MVHLVLNNMEFSSDEAANKNAMIKFLASSGSIPAYFIPLLFKSENSEEFYLLSMIESVSKSRLICSWGFVLKRDHKNPSLTFSIL